ncbi:hypothetical protein PYCC9005_000574 [Savitreella phatthalungensis]
MSKGKADLDRRSTIADQECVETQAAQRSARTIPDERTSLVEPEQRSDALEPHESRDDFAHLPAWKRPSLLWLLPPFFCTATITGATITPRLSLISDLLCLSYYTTTQEVGSSALSTTANLFAGLDGDGDCNIAEISAQISRVSAGLNVATGLLSAIMAAKYGSWSDRSGRRWPLLVALCGSFLNDLVFILVGRYHQRLTVYFLFVGAICDGLSGSFTSSMAASYAYATDIIEPSQRAIAFGYFSCCFFGGVAIGPTLGAYVTRWQGSVMPIFWAAAFVHSLFILYIICLLPESLSTRRQRENVLKHEQEADAEAADLQQQSRLARIRGALNVFRSLRILRPKDVPKAIRDNLLLLVIIDVALLLNMGTFTTILLYCKYIFRFGDLEQGYLLTIIGSVRVLALLVALPLIIKFFRGSPDSKEALASCAADEPLLEGASPAPVQTGLHHTSLAPKGADRLDVSLIRLSLAFEVLAFGFMANAASSGQFYIAAAMTAAAGMGTPTLASALTKHVPASRTGRLMGAMALIQACCRFAAPLALGLLYAETVASYPAATFVVVTGVMCFAFVLSLFVRVTSNLPGEPEMYHA